MGNISVPQVSGSMAVGLALTLLADKFILTLQLDATEIGIVGAGFGALIQFILGWLPQPKAPAGGQ